MTLVDEVTKSMSAVMKPIGQSKVGTCATKASGASCSKLKLMHVAPPSQVPRHTWEVTFMSVGEPDLAPPSGQFSTVFQIKVGTKLPSDKTIS